MASANSATPSPAKSSNVAANNGGAAKTGTATGVGIGIGFLALAFVVLFKQKRKRVGDVSYALPSYASSQKSGEGRPVMGRATRVRVAAGAAWGIAYLHEDCHPRIIHRDIKSSNILLDINFEAQVADFGLAKLAADTNTHVSTRVMGTFGYLAPEYVASGKVTEKSDVFSFGVVLLELITGRKPVDACQPYGAESFVEWACPLLTEALEKGDFDEFADSRLGKNYVAAEVFSND